MNLGKIFGMQCGCMLGILLFNMLLGGITFNYCLWYIFNKDIPWFADVVCGLFLGEVTVPLAIVCWVLDLCGIAAPLIGG